MRFMRWSLTGVVLVLVSCGGGSSSSNSEASPTPTVALPIPTDASADGVYEVGDTGPGGGIIVYVDEAGFDNSSGDDTSIGAMCLPLSCHYLEMAPTDLEGTYSWDDAIAAAELYFTPLANDWVLPSLNALNEMCKFAFGDTVNAICNNSGDGLFVNSVGGFSTGTYWSSSDVDFGIAWFWFFSNGNYLDGAKETTFYVRPVRAF